MDIGNPPLRRSRDKRMIAGVLGGIAEHFDLNVTLLRVLYVIVSIASAAFPGITPSPACALASASSKASIADRSASAERQSAVCSSPSRPERNGWSNTEAVINRPFGRGPLG